MSRIHEALKKAEQERATAPAAPLETPLAIAQETPEASHAPMPSIISQVPADIAARLPLGSDFLRFDDLKAKCAHPEWRLDGNVNVFFNPALSPHGAEQFRTLRSRLYQIRTNQQLKTVLITSSVPGEGKTFVTSNLAQAIVRQADRRVLIIDGDLRCPRLHVPLGAPTTPGLTDFLRGDVDEFAIIQHGQTENLCFIAGGTQVSDPSELLSNGRLKKLLDRVSPVFDWVLIDSPPCLPVADATMLAELADGVLMVVQAGKTPSEVAQRACQEMHGKNLLGVVLNAVEESHLYGTYYYQGYGTTYGESKEQTN